MVAIVSTNNPLTRDNRAPAPALKEDGENYSWRMFFDNDQRIVDADTPEECLDFIIRDYLLLDADARKDARLSLARLVQQLARATILGNLTQEQMDALKEWEWEVLNYGSDETGFDPYGWGDGSRPIGSEQDDEQPDFWNSDIQLVLVDTSYTPYTDILPPLSSEGDYAEVKNIIWLRPSDDLQLLRSLSRIGYITFGTPSNVVALELARKN